MLYNFRTGSKIAPLILISLYHVFLGCSDSDRIETEMNELSGKTHTYVLKGEPKTKLFLQDDGTFNYISIGRKYFPNDLFFKTSGRWQKIGDTIYLTSLEEYQDTDSTSIVKLPTTDSSYSLIRFYDIYNDSIGFMFVTYPDGRDYSQGADMGDRIFDWSENFKIVTYLEFHFVNYDNWKYYSDGKNYNLNVYLKPKFKLNVFKDEKFVLKGNTLTKALSPSTYIFLKEDSRK